MVTTIGNVPYHNTRPTSPAMRKAWEIIGRTLEGGCYCGSCVESWGVDDLIISRPIFVSDDYAGITCDKCGEALG